MDAVLTSELDIPLNALVEAALRHGERAANALQHVVEVARDVAGELADLLQLLRLAQARLRGHQFARALLEFLGVACAHLVVDVRAGANPFD